MSKSDAADRTYGTVSPSERGTGPGSAGQSGDTQGLSNVAETDSQSVEELVEEGQFLEADLVDGLENTPESDSEVKEVHTRQLPEDDVPGEYLDQD